jgi:hypothetical protein
LLGQRRVPTVTDTVIVIDTVIDTVIVIVIVYAQVISTTKDDLVRVQPAVTQPFVQLVGTHGQETLESRVWVPIRDVRV